MPAFGSHLKGVPTGGAPLTREQILAQGWQLLRGDLAPAAGGAQTIGAAA